MLSKPFQYNDETFYAYLIDNEYWFVAKHICDYLQYTNPSRTIKLHCKAGGVTKCYIPTTSGVQDMILINKSNLLRLVMNSKMEKAVIFQDWVLEIVIPSVLEKGSYSVMEENTLSQHTNLQTQKSNSKIINSIKYRAGGVDAVKEYNINNCKIHAGMTPKEVRDCGKKLGLKSKDLTSAKQVLRNIKPQIACTMSLADSLIKQNPTKTLIDIKPITLKAISVYEEMFRAGIIPMEFKK
jgi:prophage antirepressor-like protein